jgi:hypothetical protein
VVFLEGRLVVEEVELRRCAVLEEVDDALGFGGEVRDAGEASGAGLGVAAEKGGEGCASEAETGEPQEFTAGVH